MKNGIKAIATYKRHELKFKRFRRQSVPIEKCTHLRKSINQCLIVPDFLASVTGKNPENMIYLALKFVIHIDPKGSWRIGFTTPHKFREMDTVLRLEYKT